MYFDPNLLGFLERHLQVKVEFGIKKLLATFPILTIYYSFLFNSLNKVNIRNAV